MRELVLLVGTTLYLGAAALISPFSLMMSPLPLLVFTIYPYMKRFTALAHFGVGLGLALGPLGGWFAVQRSLANVLTGVFAFAVHAVLGDTLRYHLFVLLPKGS